MLKKTFKLKDIVVGDKSPTECFTEESSITVAIPSMTERMRFKEEQGKIAKDDDLSNFELLAAVVTEVDCESIEGDKVDSFDNLLCYKDGMIVMKWLTDLLTHGYVPKKISIG